MLLLLLPTFVVKSAKQAAGLLKLRLKHTDAPIQLLSVDRVGHGALQFGAGVSGA